MALARRLDVLTLIDVPIAAGGAEGVAMQIALRLDHARFRSVVCASRYTGAPSNDAERAAAEMLARGGVPLLALRRSGIGHLSAWAPLVRLLRRGQVDVLHAHLFGSNVWGTVLGRACAVPVVVAHEHGWGQEAPSRLRRLLDREIVARGSDAFVAVSHATRARMVEVARIPPDDIVVVPNGIPTPRPGRTEGIRADLGLPPSAPVIGTIAVLRPEKALDELVRVAASLRSRFPGLRVLIAGEGRERGRLEELVRALDLEGTVHLLGFRTDVANVLAALDVAVFSSVSEGSPLSVIEAMEAARPIVATRVGGVPELIVDGVHGVLVPPRDPPMLEAAVVRLLEDRRAGHEMGQRAQARRREHFDVDVMVRRFERLYEELHAKSGGRRRGVHRREARPSGHGLRSERWD